ncbi:putative gamma-glutamylcyclotransferase CG2811 isoform X1 [Diorhabda sublineata]|uniref:putative gamma-glutamylcyclotransferase CG2811 isoform X1 n=1 Tax=Diorhabda sublineata TaxID=1163346 RepID=UPI0024E0A9C3|nr:putative gamma-glutamylcyclotransferase CG2811 isoform X1 [Diorhabda sublineata]XP_056638637.1 putative gamma-glutamylcyclotransferase CG2811 isoform X1 [Diorhabda sublineata]XP_056638638.1 putative gamma-glutamylcyclotransferase CG2811 isoform X1 [Diorhabda sublineata]
MELHRVFVYGTLKRNEPNHSWFSKNTEGYYKFIGEAKTVEKLPLIIATEYNIPFILKSPGNGYNVLGELYEVDSKVLSDLDILEDHPNFYVREKFNVELFNSEQFIENVWIYVIVNFQPHLLNETCYETYSNSGSHGKKYVERYLRNKYLDYKQILQN